MKKLLLFVLAILATAGMTMAQDVYSAGYFTNSNGTHDAAVYKNGELLYQSSTGSSDYSRESTDVIYHNGDVYWVVNCMEGSDYRWADIRKNGEVYLDSPTGQGRHINAMTIFPNSSLYSAGCMNIDGVKTAVFWYDNDPDPDFVLGNQVYPSEAYAVTYARIGNSNWTVSAGVQYTSSSEYHGVIWKAGEVVYDLGSNVSPRGVAVYDGVYYTVANVYDGSTWTAKVYKNDVLLYNLSTTNSRGFSISVDAGDVYVSGWEGSYLKVWKNGEELYSISASSSTLRAVTANSTGVYYAGNTGGNVGKIWKDGELLYAPSNCEYIWGMYVEQPVCENSDIRPLPFVESFENGETNWECWTRTDENANSDSHYRPFWTRSGTNTNMESVMPYSGAHCALHGWGENAQEGWLISPQLFLQPGRDQTTLSFMSYEEYPEDLKYEGVWISTTNTSVSSFTEIWSQASPSAEWKSVEIDLSAYQGQAVYLAFKYTGEDGHDWFIDDVNVDEGWGYCSVEDVPYTYDFDGWDLTGTCWYLLDSDMSGGQRCWQYSSSYDCAYHPWGQPGVPQEGWLISKSIDLPTGMNYTLTFNTRNSSSGSDMRNSVWIALDHENEIPNPADYTMIWEESTYEDTWGERSIDLTAYAGHKVNIAFKYEGTYAHAWYVDDFSITAGVAQYNINVEANNAAWGTVTGGGTYEQGETVTITATPNSGYVFLKWIKDGYEVYTGESYTFTVTENATFTAVFGEPAVTYFDITTSANPAAGGTVTGDGTYAQGTEVTLVATANTGWHFVRWQDDNTDNPRTITVNATETYTAYFEADIYAIVVTASPEEGGNVTGGGTYPYGSVVALNAIPKADYEFLNWNDGVTTAARSVTVTGNATYVAHFVSTSTTVYSVTALSNDPTLGEVTGGGTYPEGAEVTLTATPFGDAVFTKWNDDNTDNPRTITVTGNATYTAYFEVPAMYTITVTSMNPEMGSVSGGGNFPMGAEVTIQANPFGGYYFDGWSDNNYDNPRTITVTGDATYSAKFSAQQSQTFALTTTCNPMHGYVDGSGNYPAGTEVTVTAVAYEGYEFDHWNDNETQNPRTVTVNSNMTLVAFFKATGVGENGEPEVSLYPNPAKESIRLKGIEANSEVLFYNVLGMMVKTVNANAEQEINVSDLAAGVYTVRCGHQVLRFVKE